MLERILPKAKSLVKEIAAQNDILIDATCGNGHDTKFMADLAGPSGKVYSFDIQEEALDNAKTLTEGLSNIHYILDSHANVDKYINENVKAAMFNLGYLPKGDKSITTKSDSTLEAITQIFGILEPGGRIVIVVYHGHPGGKEEKDALYDFLMQLPPKEANVLEYRFINQKNSAPFIFCIEKTHAAQPSDRTV